MPLRSLIYLATILKPQIAQSDIYGKRRVTIPTPRCVVFYNGEASRPEIEIQRLSDSYVHDGEDIPVELICTVYNINPGMNEDLKDSCEVLNQYTQFVEKVKEYIRKEDESPVQSAVEFCIQHDILVDFLKRRGREVIKNMAIDMTFEAREKIFRREEREEGREEGRIETIIKLLNEGTITLDIAINNLKVTPDELEEIQRKYSF